MTGNRVSRSNRSVWVPLLVVLTAFISNEQPRTAEAASGTASGASWSTRNSPSGSGSASWFFSDPTEKDTIDWTSGGNLTDDILWQKDTFGPEQKFTFTFDILGRTFGGFTDDDGPGAGGSRTATSGSGSSSSAGSAIPIPKTARWKVNATGSLGFNWTTTAGFKRGPRWSAQAEGKDPWNITQDQLDNLSITGSTFDLFIPIGLEATDFSENGGVVLTVSYETATETTILLNLDLSDGVFDVTSDLPTGLSFLSLSTITDQPPDDLSTVTPISLADIQTTLAADLGSDRSLDSPLFVGLVWAGIPIPTTALSDGSLARIHDDLMVDDADAREVPEPSTAFILVMLMGVGGSGARLWRRDRADRANRRVQTSNATRRR